MHRLGVGAGALQKPAVAPDHLFGVVARHAVEARVGEDERVVRPRGVGDGDAFGDGLERLADGVQHVEHRQRPALPDQLSRALQPFQAEHFGVHYVRLFGAHEAQHFFQRHAAVAAQRAVGHESFGIDPPLHGRLADAERLRYLPRGEPRRAVIHSQNGWSQNGWMEPGEQVQVNVALGHMRGIGPLKRRPGELEEAAPIRPERFGRFPVRLFYYILSPCAHVPVVGPPF